MSDLLPVAQLLNHLNRVEGRKKMQKVVHILQELGCPFPFRFEYSFYGMYSQQLRAALDRLEEEGLLTEQPTVGAIHESYTFRRTEKLENLLPELGFQEPPSWGELASRLNGLSPQEAEAVSTILYLQRLGYAGDALKSKLSSLKPHLDNLASDCLTIADGLPRARTHSQAA